MAYHNLDYLGNTPAKDVYSHSSIAMIILCIVNEIYVQIYSKFVSGYVLQNIFIRIEEAEDYNKQQQLCTIDNGDIKKRVFLGRKEI